MFFLRAEIFKIEIYLLHTVAFPNHLSHTDTVLAILFNILLMPLFSWVVSLGDGSQTKLPQLCKVVNLDWQHSLVSKCWLCMGRDKNVIIRRFFSKNKVLSALIIPIEVESGRSLKLLVQSA